MAHQTKIYKIKKISANMVVQIDEETNTVCSKWYSLEKIKQYTSYNPDSIKDAIKNKKHYGGCIWLEYNN